jgi:predicted nucleic acid-binding protein
VSVVFADTSFYVALLNRSDIHHDLAVELSKGRPMSTVTTEYVLVEVANWFSRSKQRQTFRAVIEQLRKHPDVVIVASSHELFERGLDLYFQRADKDWSLTDCISMVILNDRHVTQVLRDHHFEQAGFEVLLK